MKSKIGLILASATLAITGTNLKASAFEAHTPTLNFSESTLNNTIGQQNIGGNQELQLVNQGVNKLKGDVIEQVYAHRRRRSGRG